MENVNNNISSSIPGANVGFSTPFGRASNGGVIITADPFAPENLLEEATVPVVEPITNFRKEIEAAASGTDSLVEFDRLSLDARNRLVEQSDQNDLFNRQKRIPQSFIDAERSIELEQGRVALQGIDNFANSQRIIVQQKETERLIKEEEERLEEEQDKIDKAAKEDLQDQAYVLRGAGVIAADVDIDSLSRRELRRLVSESSGRQAASKSSSRSTGTGTGTGTNLQRVLDNIERLEKIRDSGSNLEPETAAAVWVSENPGKTINDFTPSEFADSEIKRLEDQASQNKNDNVATKADLKAQLEREREIAELVRLKGFGLTGDERYSFTGNGSGKKIVDTYYDEKKGSFVVLYDDGTQALSAGNPGDSGTDTGGSTQDRINAAEQVK